MHKCMNFNHLFIELTPKSVKTPKSPPMQGLLLSHLFLAAPSEACWGHQKRLTTIYTFRSRPFIACFKNV